MKNLFLLLLFPVFFTACDLAKVDDTLSIKAVKFEKWFGNLGEIEENGNAVIELTEGGYVVAGYQEQAVNTNNEGFLVKFSEQGDVIWSKHVKLGSYSTFSALQRTADGGYIAVGTTYISASAQNDLFLCKFDKDGNTAFVKNFSGPLGSEYGTDALIINEGFLILGTTSGNNDSQILLLKTDALGNLLDTKTYGGIGYEAATKMTKTLDGGYAITGNTSSFGAGQGDMYLMKLNSSLVLSWQKSFGGSFGDNGADIVEASDGSFILGGQKGDTNAPDILVVKTDKNGNKLWEKTYGTPFYDYAQGIDLTANKNIVLSGTKGDNNDSVVFIIQLNASGDLNWERLFSRYYGTDIHATKDGGLIVTGARNNPSDKEEDVYLIKTDKDGNVL